MDQSNTVIKPKPVGSRTNGFIRMQPATTASSLPSMGRNTMGGAKDSLRDRAAAK